MKRKAKITIGTRIDDRTKWILQELADIKNLTVSELVSGVLTDFVECRYSTSGFCEYDIYLMALKNEYDDLTSRVGYNYTLIEDEINKIDLSSVRLMQSDVNRILKKIKKLNDFELIPGKEIENFVYMINERCRALTSRNIVDILDILEEGDE